MQLLGLDKIPDLKLNEVYATMVTLGNGSIYTVHHSIEKRKTYFKFKALKDNLSNDMVKVEFTIQKVEPVKILE